MFMHNKYALVCAVVGASLSIATSASAAVIDWTNWTSSTNGNPGGSATGTASGVTVNYSGELQALVANYPSWGPTSTFSGGSVGNAPPQAYGIIRLYGGQLPTGGYTTDTITFSKAVTNPVMAIWSLGQGGINASFNFNATPTLQSGGPSAEYSGSSIVVSGNNVYGSEGNGTVQFTGTYTSLSWTNPTYEGWYGFTVGVSAVPEPGEWALMLSGISLMGFMVRRKKSA